ncbi:MAG: cation diffusion facilitator family transporter, partial [Planctomycetota bacterium]
GAVGAFVAVVVIATAVHVLRRSTGELMDRSLPPGEIETLLAAVRLSVPEVRGLHDVRTRKSGATVFMDAHVQLDRSLSFVEAHRLSERVRLAIERERPNAWVTVHADPDPLHPSDLDPGMELP